MEENPYRSPVPDSEDSRAVDEDLSVRDALLYIFLPLCVAVLVNFGYLLVIR